MIQTKLKQSSNCEILRATEFCERNGLVVAFDLQNLGCGDAEAVLEEL
jgi:hypothetical protein